MSLLVSNMTKTEDGATGIEMELIGPESCDKVRTWYTAAFGLDLVSLTVKKYISKLDVMIVGKL